MSDAIIIGTHDAMATTFEIAIAGEEPPYARRAIQSAFLELDRIESELSRYRPTSDIARLNRLSPGEVLRLGIDAFSCLALAAQVHAATAGLFDVTVGPLIDYWRNAGASISDRDARHPDKSADLSTLLERVGMSQLKLNGSDFSVTVRREGVVVDLGAIGKGYAVDVLARNLREDWSIAHAIIHGGQSSALAFGSPTAGSGADDSPGWRVDLRDGRGSPATLGSLCLHERSLSGSGMALHGMHIIDPRSGRPARVKHGSWAVAGSAALSDAVSTAAMIMNPEEIHDFCSANPEIALITLTEENGVPLLRQYGVSPVLD